MTSVAFIGVGNMGEALLAGVLASGAPASDLAAVVRREERGRELQAAYGIRVIDMADAAASDVLFLGVKPADTPALVATIAPHVGTDTVVVSLAAGLSTASLESALPAGTSVVRAMPNTAVRVGEGVTALSAGAACTAEDLGSVRDLLAATGLVVEVPEKLQDVVVATSGSGIAYVFYVVEAMVEASVTLGMPRAAAVQMVGQTLMGAATMIRETGTAPGVLREQVTSPGGTTAAALRQLDAHGVRAAFMAAMEAAQARSAELGDGS